MECTFRCAELHRMGRRRKAWALPAPVPLEVARLHRETRLEIMHTSNEKAHVEIWIYECHYFCLSKISAHIFWLNFFYQGMTMSKDQRITEHIAEKCDKNEYGRETQEISSLSLRAASLVGKTRCIVTCPGILTTVLMNGKGILLIILRHLN